MAQSTISRWSIAAAAFGGVCNLLCLILDHYQFDFLARVPLTWSVSSIVSEAIGFAPSVSPVRLAPFYVGRLDSGIRAFSDLELAHLSSGTIFLFWRKPAVLQNRLAGPALNAVGLHLDGWRRNKGGNLFCSSYRPCSVAQLVRIMTLICPPAMPIANPNARIVVPIVAVEIRGLRRTCDT